jgi:hypothetical protein
MKKLLGIALIALIVVFTSCDELGLGGIPIEQEFVEIFELTIDENTLSHVGDTVLIDLSELDEFADITDQIKSIEIKKIALDIIEYTAPEDLYISGGVFASNDSFASNSINVGELSPIEIYSYYSSSEQITLEIDSATVNQLSEWLVEKNEAAIAYDFSLLNSELNNYEFMEEDFGSLLTIKVTVVIKALLSGIPDLGI